MSVFNLSNAIMGSGILGLSYAMANTGIDLAVLNLRCVCSEWYLNGNYLVVFVSIGIILPLSLLKNLGKDKYCFIYFLCGYFAYLFAEAFGDLVLCDAKYVLKAAYSHLCQTRCLYALRHNTTLMDFSRADITPAVTSSRDAHHSTGVHFKPHPDEEEMCRPKYFIFNSQVAGEGCWTRTFSLHHK
ncbi:hypothetical protein GOODEAATRI_002581, partial [Goodea atripinnis]